jgi:O-antigen/teichoic acid export membrane protein
MTRTVARNSLALLSSRIVSAAAGALFTVLAARAWGPGTWGVYSTAILLMGYAYPLCDWGQQRLLTRSVAVDARKAGTLLTGALTVRLATIPVVMIGLWILPDKSFKEASGIAILSASCVPVVGYLTIDALLQGAERMDLAAALEIPHAVAKALAGVVVVIALGGSLRLLFSAFVLLDSGRAIAGAVLCKRTLGIPLKLQWNANVTRSMAWNGVATMLWAVLFVAYYRMDLSLLSMLRSESDVGLYAAAYRLIDLVVMIAVAINAALLPAMAREFALSPGGLNAMYQKAFRYFLISILLIAGLMVVGAQGIVTLLYGRQYAPAARALEILAVAIVPGCLSYLAGTALMAADRYRLVPVAYGVLILFKLALSLVLVPRFGYVGTSVVEVISDAVACLVLVVLCHRVLGQGKWGFAVRAILAGCAAWGLGYAVTPLNWWAGQIVGMSSYILFVVLLRILRWEDLAPASFVTAAANHPRPAE